MANHFRHHQTGDLTTSPGTKPKAAPSAPAAPLAVPSAEPRKAASRKAAVPKAASPKAVAQRRTRDQRRRTKPPRGASHKFRNFVITLVVVVVVGAAAYVAVPRIIGAVNAAGSSSLNIGSTVQVYVPSGSTTRDIAGILKTGGVISNTSDFINAVEAENNASNLKPGTYSLVVGTSNDDLVAALVAGPPDTGIKLTIPEGLTVQQTAAIVEKTCGIPAADFIAEANSADKYAADFPFVAGAYNNSLEGFLYPLTYQVPVGANAETVIRLLLKQYAIETADVDWSYAASKGLSEYDVIKIASMIEKETFTADERPLVSSVIYNRLSTGMRLQICSTVVYALGPDSRDFGINPLLYVDLQVDSPYNTYTHDGLPPGPICSPQLASIEAAAAPADTTYIYYVLTSKDGTHTFCTTSDEFAQANAVYRQVFGLN
ncbi:MAG: endolytic transglycosylase MltG [Coriobacteriia bacterium]|nr:endolytic transglycosylase MltG [Coriobacteriia bacterium]